MRLDVWITIEIFNQRFIYCYSTFIIMSDDECAFDNWEQAAEEQPQIAQQKQELNTQQNKEDEKEQIIVKPESAKQTLKQKIDQMKSMTNEQFEAKQLQLSALSNSTLKLKVGKIMKTEKDFAEFGKLIAQKLCEGLNEDQTLDQDSITVFFEELVGYLYKGLEWENFFEIQKKFKSLKNQRKNDQKRIQKEKQRKRNKAQQQASLSISSSRVMKGNEKEEEKVQDELFGGVSLINSKQQQQERKKKALKVEEAEKPKPPPVEDDDDFM